MNPWLHHLSGGFCLVGAIAMAVKPALFIANEDATAIDANARDTTQWHEKFISQEASPPQKRSVKSRQADPSMATRFRREGTVTVGGFVKAPGPIPISGAMTLWQAIQQAGGATEFGSLRRVKLFRDGKQMTFDLTKGTALTEILKANDTLEVPQREPWGT